MIARRPSKNPHAEAEQFRRRAALGFAMVALALIGLAAWYFKLQVIDHDQYATLSEANRIKLWPVVPGRGAIYDRNGKLLAENVPAFRLEVTPDKAGNSKRLITELSEIVALTPEDIARYEEDRKTSRGFRAVTLKPRMTEDEMARFAVNRWRFPGVELVPYLTRRYPYGDLFAHVIGYVGRIDEKDLETLGEGNAALTHIGKTGLERYYETALRGKVGYKQVETNVQGRALRVVGRVPAVPGSDLKLSIDAELQRAIVMAFGEFEGSAIAVDPRTGEVLAMVSLPSYDPNLFVNGISNKDFKALNENPSRPQFNRLVLGGVAPGSTIKPLLALAGLDSGLRRPEDKVLSTGMFYLPGTRRGWGDASRGGHGWTDLRKSISQSVNTYYYRLALDMGIERFDEYMERYGFGKPTGIDLVGEISGILPSPAAKLKATKVRWYPGDTVNASIGQGDWKVTPLQLVQATAALADGGNLRRPHLVREQRTGFDADWQPLTQPDPIRISPNPANVAVVREGMLATMLPGGTGASTARGAPYLMAGKTGTAQVVSRRGTASVNPRSLPMHLRHRALFVGFAPADNPTIAVAIAVEGGGYGGTTAGPIARKIFDAYLLGKLPESEDGSGESETGGERGTGNETVPPAAPALDPAATPPAGAAIQSPSPSGRGAGERVWGEVDAGARVEPKLAPISLCVPAPTLVPTHLPKEEGLRAAPTWIASSGSPTGISLGSESNVDARAGVSIETSPDFRFPIPRSPLPASRLLS